MYTFSKFILYNSTFLRDLDVRLFQDSRNKSVFLSFVTSTVTGTLVPQICLNNNIVGRDGSVAIATHYGLDVPEIEFLLGLDFLHPSRPALGLTHPPVQWVAGFFLGVKAVGA